MAVDIKDSCQGKISVLMGIYNCASTLKQAIDSIFAQTYTNWELILCDDCSTDETFNIAKNYQDAYPNRIVLLHNEVNSKLPFTLNRCLEVATGEYVARMDGDDICYPDRFEKQVEFLECHPDIVMVGTAMQRFSDDGSLGAIDYADPFPNNDTPYRRGVVFNHATILAYRYVFDALGGYTDSPRTVRCEDRDLWYRFLLAGYKGANIPEPLYMVRENEAAIKRRSPKVRWNSFKTEIIGYSMLHYPLYRFLKPTSRLVKILVPTWLMLRYRDWQAKRQ